MPGKKSTGGEIAIPVPEKRNLRSTDENAGGAPELVYWRKYRTGSRPMPGFYVATGRMICQTD